MFAEFAIFVFVFARIKRLLILLTFTTGKTTTKKRAFVYLPLTLRVSVSPRPSVPCCNSGDFPHLGFTDKTHRHNSEFVTHTNKNCAKFRLDDKHNRIIVNIIIKSWPSAVIYSSQDFEQEKSVKTEMLFY